MDPASWWVTAAISVSVAIVTGGGSWLLVRPQMKKAEADAAESLTQTAMLLLGEYRDEYGKGAKRIAALLGQMEAQECKETVLIAGIGLLTEQIRKQGCIPDWEIKEVSQDGRDH